MVWAHTKNFLRFVSMCWMRRRETKRCNLHSLWLLSLTAAHRQTSFALFFLLLFSPVHSTIAPESEKNSMLYYAVLWEIPKRARKLFWVTLCLLWRERASVLNYRTFQDFRKLLLPFFLERRQTSTHHTPSPKVSRRVRSGYMWERRRKFLLGIPQDERAKGDCDFCFFADGAIALRLRSTMIFLIDLFPCSPAWVIYLRSVHMGFLCVFFLPIWIWKSSGSRCVWTFRITAFPSPFHFLVLFHMIFGNAIYACIGCAHVLCVGKVSPRSVNLFMVWEKHQNHTQIPFTSHALARF